MNEIDAKSMILQRRILGFLSISLSPVCFLFGLIGSNTNPQYWYKSISLTFYSNSNIFMIGILTATAIYFFSYKGYDWKDRLCSLIQAIACVGIVVFPCRCEFYDRDTVGLFCLNMNISNILHSIFAALLFLSFAFNLIFLFTLSSGEKTEKKKIRNLIYRISGLVIFICTIAMCFKNYVIKIGIVPEWFPYVLMLEFIALTVFGFSYIVKSETIKYFND